MEKPISGTSWHFKIYQWWKNESHFDKDKPLGFRENLCHYMRVVLIWGPIGWFFRYPLWGKIPPALYVIGAVVLVMVGVIATVNPLALVVGIGMVVAIIAFFMVAIYLAELSERHPNTAGRFIRILTSPTSFLIRKLMSFCDTVVEPLLFTKNKYLIPSWLLLYCLIGGIVTLASGLAGLQKYVIGTAILSGAFAAATVILVTIFAIHSTIEGYKERKAKRNALKGISTVGLFRAFLNTKRGSRICPYIKLPAEEGEE
ncbi:hypothetical protein KBA63_05020 [Candidatus Woesebacteria bacterium]|nr:hypothetical protein [Candidatus Woesebacteria bacterium]